MTKLMIRVEHDKNNLMKILVQKISPHYPASTYCEVLVPDTVLHTFTYVSHSHNILDEN